jgi:omega-6 fatty acid desaturase (delta-12 desaturase)
MSAVQPTAVSPVQALKEQQRALVREHANSTDRQGLQHVLVTVIPLALAWWAAIYGLRVSLWLTAAATLAITVLLIRVFALMHECGHGSLFRTQRLNRSVGFLFGVLSGIPQYVWSRNHHYHHRTNGNWDVYRGPVTTLSLKEFEALSIFRQGLYQYARHIGFAPLAGFVYLIFSPRFNWIRGSLSLLLHLLRGKPASTFETRLWKSWKEYRHQSANNAVLLSWWALMCWAIGAGPFFTIYLASISIAGGVGIVLFTVQHNFEHSYASENDGWDLDEGALSGTSFLILPGWMNWVTANIGFHHIHHLSASIPGYSLPKCHAEYAHLFKNVRRITLREVPYHLTCLLWDSRARRIISFRDYRKQKAAELASAEKRELAT